MASITIPLPTCATGRATSVSQPTKQPLTVSASIEFTDFLDLADGAPYAVSPDGRRFVTITHRGDVVANGRWYDIYAGSLRSLQEAQRARVVAHLFTRSMEQVRDVLKQVRWRPNSTDITFIWDDGVIPPQVYLLDTLSGALQPLTRLETEVWTYDLSANGRLLAYGARAPYSAEASSARRRDGFVVQGEDLTLLLLGYLDGRSPWLDFETLVQRLPENTPRKVPFQFQQGWRFGHSPIFVSPDGHYALTAWPTDKVPADWGKYENRIFLDSEYAPSQQVHPSYVIQRLVIIDCDTLRARDLWNAPVGLQDVNVVWSSDSKRVLIGPTFLPLDASDALGRRGGAAVEYNTEMRTWTELPVPPAHVGAADSSDRFLVPQRWLTENSAEVRVSDDRLGKSAHMWAYKRSADARWVPVVARSVTPQGPPVGGVKLEVRQGLNEPPRLFAQAGKSGRGALILDPNPHFLQRFALGRVDTVHWQARDGRAWTGLLHYPVGYSKDHRYPLVLQTHGYQANTFQLSGTPLTTAFAAQAMSNRGFAVLQMGGPDDEAADAAALATPREAPLHMAGYEGAIDHLDSAQLIDRSRVGIIGFSRTGWLVLYFLTHSDIAPAAALVSQNIDNGYLQRTIFGSDGFGGSESERDNGGTPFGEGLKEWLKASPGFNADKIRTPLRMEADGFLTGLLNPWEVFSRLRDLGRPVEIVALPDFDRMPHILQNPRQRLASQGGAVDWFDFWLNGHEDPDPAKADQYRRWREMRQQRDAQRSLPGTP